MSNLYWVQCDDDWGVFCYAPTANKAKSLSYHFYTNEVNYMDVKARLLQKDQPYPEGVEENWNLICERYGYIWSDTHERWFENEQKMKEYRGEKCFGK